MSTLLVDELYNGVVFTQNVKIQKDVNLAHVRPWIYKQGTLADGTFTCDIKDGATVLASSTITFGQINGQISSTYAHGYIRFDFHSLALRIPEGATEKEYTLDFYMAGHSTDPSNFIGIVRQWEDESLVVYGAVDLSGNPVNDCISPAGLEFFEYI